MKLPKPLIKLDFSFDSSRILNEIPDLWVDHFIPDFSKAGNDALLLVTTNGEQNHTHIPPMKPTPALESMPYTKSIWKELGIGFERARLMRIKPRGEMPKHYDVHPSWDDKIRLHIPVKTNDKVIFSCEDMDVNMKAGECWALDNSGFHGVVNGGDEERIHLVIDVDKGFAQ